MTNTKATRRAGGPWLAASLAAAALLLVASSSSALGRGGAGFSDAARAVAEPRGK